MARRTQEITVTGDAAKDRDVGKKFLITEMSAMAAERWAARALLAIMNVIELSDDEADAGMAGVASAMSRTGINFTGGAANFAEIEPLLDEMLGCIQIMEKATTRALTEDDVEEIQTLFMLRSEVLKLHTNFSLIERLSVFGKTAKKSAG